MTLSELEEEARRRKERLAQWKLNKQNGKVKRKEYEDEENDMDKEKDEGNGKDLQEEAIEFPKPIFRNYKPSDSGRLSGAIVLPKPKLIDVKSMVRASEAKDDRLTCIHSDRRSSEEQRCAFVDFPRRSDRRCGSSLVGAQKARLGSETRRGEEIEAIGEADSESHC